jgi:hypothetical protein
MAGEYVPGSGGKDCSKQAGGWGLPMTDFEYIWYSNASQSDYPDEACLPFYHKAAQIDNIQVNTEVTGGAVNMTGEVKSNGGGHVLSNKKNLPFDMPHPNKKGWRLRHVCIEGPEIAVYCRGKVPPDGIIHLPTFWKGLVNPEDMTISLTPVGSWQELYVERVLWGTQVIVKNNAGGGINADYYIVARRLDDDLVVEYEGESHEDYPGGNDGYTFSWEDGYVKGLIKKYVNENLDKDP